VKPTDTSNNIDAMENSIATAAATIVDMISRSIRITVRRT
jgi:hypothetical protein